VCIEVLEMNEVYAGLKASVSVGFVQERDLVVLPPLPLPLLLGVELDEHPCVERPTAAAHADALRVPTAMTWRQDERFMMTPLDDS
jgi:hypothetical protein